MQPKQHTYGLPSGNRDHAIKVVFTNLVQQIIGLIDFFNEIVRGGDLYSEWIRPWVTSQRRSELMQRRVGRRCRELDKRTRWISFGKSRPSKPSRIPMTSQPSSLAARTTPLMTELSPATYPPPMLIAMRCWVASMSILS